MKIVKFKRTDYRPHATFIVVDEETLIVVQGFGKTEYSFTVDCINGEYNPAANMKSALGLDEVPDKWTQEHFGPAAGLLTHTTFAHMVIDICGGAV